ncbi:MAG: phosphoenolpyruvate--protein phosphotransferase [Acidobacteriota bacterium]|nr:phosphoenolpyruvate--protein phosphotransferase [Acidobacteriota bacterium]
MVVLERTIGVLQQGKKNLEIILSGRAVSRGAAIGKAVCLYGRSRQFYRLELKNNQIEGELRRFRAAVRLAKRQLTKIGGQKSGELTKNKANIFNAHLLILEDELLLSKIEDHIKEQKINAEWAVKTVIDSFVANYKSFSDEHLRERYIDLEDISDRLLTALGGGGKSNVHLDENSIIVAKDVKPSTLIELTEANLKGIITERGGWTSHTFILARELSLPAVTGIGEILRQIQTGDEIIIDGFNGKIILFPSEDVLQKYKIAAKQFQNHKSETFEPVKDKLKTLDGREIIIRANIDLPKGYQQAKRFGAQGIGLYRSEFLFNQYKGFPSEQEQITAYRKIARMVGDEGVRIRTFDLSAEQISGKNSEREQNPALGLRGIRLGVSDTKQFRIQLRSLLQAAKDNKIDIVLPMISDVSEILLTKKILRQERERLIKRGVEVGNPKLGAMIEVPSAVLTAEEIAREADFLSLGTNDLVQYLLAVDRDNQSVAEWFRTLHPAVIRAIKMVLAAAEKTDVPVLVCGEMAGSPFYAPILIGLGATVLSMNVNSIPRVGKIISGIAFEEAREIVKLLETCRTADEAEDLVRNSFVEKWSHLFSEDILPAKKLNSRAGKFPKHLKNTKKIKNRDY